MMVESILILSRLSFAIIEIRKRSFGCVCVRERASECVWMREREREERACVCGLSRVETGIINFCSEGVKNISMANFASNRRSLHILRSKREREREDLARFNNSIKIKRVFDLEKRREREKERVWV